MTTYIEVSHALLKAGYLAEADVDAAAKVLEGALKMDLATEAKKDALDDEAHQQDLIEEAEQFAEEDSMIGYWDSVDSEEETINQAKRQVKNDEAAAARADSQIAKVCLEAATALAAVNLIDDADAEAVAGVIKKVWVVEDR